jgi:hypothetical protein
VSDDRPQDWFMPTIIDGERATMTAIWCNSREHAELLRQSFGGDQ